MSNATRPDISEGAPESLSRTAPDEPGAGAGNMKQEVASYIQIERLAPGTGWAHANVLDDVELTVTDNTQVVSETTERRQRREFEELVRRHHASAFNVAYRMTGSRTDAEDLTQEAFLRAYRFFGNYRREMPFESWLYKIMSNVWIDTLRRKPKNGAPISLDQAMGATEQPLDVPDDRPTPEEDLMERTFDTRVQAALSAVNKDFRMAIILADIEGMSYEEIADIMKCSIGTVRSRIHRGRQAMKEKLGSLRDLLGEEAR